MKLIVITAPEFLYNEEQHLRALLSAGLGTLHIRKPNCSQQQIKKLIDMVPEEYHPRLVLHQHYDLAKTFNLGGIHITGNTKHEDLLHINPDIKRSRSCHSLDEVKIHFNAYEYLFLSPVFNSISKEGYQSPFNIEELKEFFLKHPKIKNCIALGGIEKIKLNLVKEIGFSGCAVLGSIWGNKNTTISEVIKRFQEIQSQMNNL